MDEVRKFKWIDQVSGSVFMKPIEPDDLRLSEVVLSTYVHEQQLIKIVDREGRAHISDTVARTVGAMATETIKIEGMQHFSAVMSQRCDILGKRIYGHFYGPITAHVFIAKEGSGSFPMHTDQEDVVLYVIEGTKKFIAADKEYILEKGDTLYIPKNTPHQAVNISDSVMISFGLEEWINTRLG